RQRIGKRTGGERDDEGERSLGADQCTDRCRRVDKVDEDHRCVCREHRDRHGEAEGRQAQQDQQWFDLCGGLPATRKVKLPALRMALVTVRQARDECSSHVEPSHALAAAAAVATSLGYVFTARKSRYALAASGTSIRTNVHCNPNRPPPKT